MPDITQTKRPRRIWKSTARSNRLRFGLEAASVGGLFHQRYPIIGTTGLFQLKFGRTSAPRLPQATHAHVAHVGEGDLLRAVGHGP
jgi:hypothetical protein